MKYLVKIIMFLKIIYISSTFRSTLAIFSMAIWNIFWENPFFFLRMDQKVKKTVFRGQTRFFKFYMAVRVYIEIKDLLIWPLQRIFYILKKHILWLNSKWQQKSKIANIYVKIGKYFLNIDNSPFHENAYCNFGVLPLNKYPFQWLFS